MLRKTGLTLLCFVGVVCVAASAPLPVAHAQVSGAEPDAERVRAANLKLGEELPEPRPAEVGATTILMAAMVGQLKDQQSKGAKLIARDQHPKQHGCVRATFEVAADLPESLRVGVFAKPRTYHAAIRFSNGGAAKDNEPDVRGMAIKLLGVEGPSLIAGGADAGTQDFILVDHPVFFAIDPKDLVEFIGASRALAQAEQAGDVTKAAAIQQRQEADFAIFKEMKKFGVPSPLEITYFGQTPYRLGRQAVKYVVTPDPGNKSGRPPLTAGSPPDALRAAMVDHLTTGKKAASFRFGVVVQTDPVKMPIENPTVLWAGDPVTLATITISPQEFTRDDQLRFGENLSYTPWHALAVHQPLGGINRARKPIYEATSQLRHDINMVPRQEPTVATLDALFPVATTGP